MKLRNKTVFSIGLVASIAASGSYLYAGPSNNASNSSTISSQDEKLIQTNIDSLFPFPTKISSGKFSKAYNGDFVLNNVYVKSIGKSNPNIFISKMTLHGLAVDGNASNNFDIKIQGLKLLNAAKAVAHTNVVSARIDPEKLMKRHPLFNNVLKDVGKSSYDLDISYDNSSEQIHLKLNSTNDGAKFITADMLLKDADMSHVKFNHDFFASLSRVIENSKLKSGSFDADLSKVTQHLIDKYLSKENSKSPSIYVKGDYSDSSNQLELSVKSNLGDKSHLYYTIDVDGTSISDTSLVDIINQKTDLFKNAYVKSNSSDFNLNLVFNRKDFPGNSPAQSVFTSLKQDKVAININSNSDYSNDKYNASFGLSGNNLGSLKYNMNGKSDGDVSVMSYFGGGNTQASNLYNCKNNICINNFSIKLANQGILQKAARMTNDDANTSPNQILSSYGALLQLLAVQQHDKFMRKMLSSFAMFLQNPKTLTISAKAKRPINSSVLIKMLADDSKQIASNSPIKSNGRVNPDNDYDLKLINNIQKMFNISFDVK